MALQVTVVFMANVRTMFDKDWTSTWEEQEAWLKRKKEHEDAVEAKKAREVCATSRLSDDTLYAGEVHLMPLQKLSVLSSLSIPDLVHCNRQRS